MTALTRDPEVCKRSVPLILDTNIGSEPGAMIAVAIAAGSPNLSLVITSDEKAGDRARLARHLLDLLGRTDVPVVAGRDLASGSAWAVAGLIPGHVPPQRRDVVSAVLELLKRNENQAIWLGLGPMSNLSDLIEAAPLVGERLTIIQLGGALQYFPDRAEPNIALDVNAARWTLAVAKHLMFVPAEVTFHPLNAITQDSFEVEIISRSSTPAFALMRRHIDQWFDRESRNVVLREPLTLALALDGAFSETVARSIELDELGCMRNGEYRVEFADGVDYLELGQWLVQRLLEIEGMGDQASSSAS